GPIRGCAGVGALSVSERKCDEPGRCAVWRPTMVRVRLRGWLIGLLSAAVTVGVGEAVAAFVRPAAAPVIAVGNRIIVLTPESLKRATIRNVGTNDKALLIAGIYLLLAVL